MKTRKKKKTPTGGSDGKSVAFQCNNNEQVEKEIRKTIRLTIASASPTTTHLCPLPPKYPGINLIKEVKDLYKENYKTLKKIPEDQKTSHVHQFAELIL
jgi:hypothetical protein